MNKNAYSTIDLSARRNAQMSIKMKKYLIRMFVAVFILAVSLSIQADAAGADAIKLDETGTITIVSQHAAKDEVSSLQFSLSVDAADAANIEFRFYESNAKVQEFRYDEDGKKLNVYLAGTEALFAENTDTLTIGKIVISDGNGSNAAATVSVVEDSLAYVYGTELKTMEDLELPGAVQIGAPTQSGQPVQPSQPEDSGNSQGSNNSSQGSSGGTQGSNNSSQGNSGGTQGSNNSSQGSSGGTQGTNNSSQGSNKGSHNSNVQGTGISQVPSDNSDKTSDTKPEAEDSLGETGEEIPSSVQNPTEENREQIPDDTKTAEGVDWIFVLVVIVVLVCAAVIVMAVVVLNKKPKFAEDQEKE